MTSFRVHPLLETDIPEAAAFLEARIGESAGGTETTVAPSQDRLRASLAWHLRNPARPHETPLGQVLRDADGTVAGTHLQLPERFGYGTRAVNGLCSSALFASDDARREVRGPAAMFLDFLRTPGYEFKFATSCNPFSGAAWRGMGGTAMARAGIELLFALRVGPLAEEYARRARLGGGLARAAGALASLAQPLVARRDRPRLAAAPCADWERLAAVSEACRDPDWITGLRDAPYLAWRYGEIPNPVRPDFHLLCEGGREVGWFARLASRRGHRGRIRTQMLVDLVWQRDRVRPEDALRAVLGVCRADSDLLVVRGRARLGDAPERLGARQRLLPEPTTYVRLDPKAALAPPERFDLTPGDGDAAM